jgi:Ca2+-binding EF-hand superfamily protein
MKRTKVLLLAVFNLMLAGFTARAQAGPNDEPNPGAPGGPPHGPPPIAMLLTGLLDKYDVNKDGQLDQTELATLKQDIAEGKLPAPLAGPRLGGPPHLPKEILDQYDVNHDGKLDENERAALRQDIQDGKIQLPPGMGPRGPGGPPPTAKEIIAKYDTDQDGKLSEAELEAFLKDLPRHRPPPFGPPGPFHAPQPGAAPSDAPQQ